MKQASRVWNRTFDKAVQKWEPHPLRVVHLSYIISIASNAVENYWFKADLRSKWKISDLGEAKFALGIGSIAIII
jgi:hypothetical protein